MNPLPTYNLYGLCLRSQWPLPSYFEAGVNGDRLELYEAPASFFLEASRKAGMKWDSDVWSQYARLHDGSDYIRWSKLFEFLISPDGRRIAAHPLAENSLEAFSTYMSGQVISYALIKLGIEPLHATVVVVDGSAVAFIGDAGYGKSTLAAAFLKAGHLMLTDDLLVLKGEGRNLFACPGPPRIKLYPEIAKALLSEQATGISMNPYTRKMIIPLYPKQVSREPIPLKAIYVLSSPEEQSHSDRVVIRRLSQSRAFLDLISNTFNSRVTHHDRLAQQFAWAGKLSTEIPLKSLSYRLDLLQIEKVVATICSDLDPR